MAIAIGANLFLDGISPTRRIHMAIKEIASLDIRICAISRFVENPSFPDPSDPPFVNAAILISTSLCPVDLLSRLHEIENHSLRVRRTRWAPRTLDLDLIAAEETILPDYATLSDWITASHQRQRNTTPEELLLPHPRLQDRAFVLGPMRDVWPEWRHPILKVNIETMWQNLPMQHRNELTPLQNLS